MRSKTILFVLTSFFLTIAFISINSNVLADTADEESVTASASKVIGSATIDVDHPGFTIGPKFMGLSHQEMSEIGTIATNPNIPYRNMLKNLLDYGAGPIMIRVGSDEPVPAAYPLSVLPAAPLVGLTRNVWAHFYLGINLCADDLSFATAQMKEWRTMGYGSYEAIEVGNEPDLYHGNCRPKTYSMNDYLGEFAEWRAMIMPMLPKQAKLMGPSWSNLTDSYNVSTLAQLPKFLSEEEQNMAIISNHYYPGYSCGGHTNAPEFLLQDVAASAGAKAVAGAVTVAHKEGLPFRIGEMNSIACGGEYGVSDIFAATLWMADTLFEFANVGIDGVNVHTAPGTAYSLFTFGMVKLGTGSQKTYVLTQAGSEYYGLLFFQQATPKTSSLIPVKLTTKANLKVWATQDQDGNVRVAIINKDLTADGKVTLFLPGKTSGTVTRMIAPSYKSMTGISIGGKTFDGSTTGELVGKDESETVSSKNGEYSVTMSPTSAAIVTFKQ